MSGLQKNVASQKWTVFAFDRTDNTAKTGDAAQITADLYLDGAVNAVDDANPTELAHGYYEFDITQAETNADMISIDPVSATGDIQVIGVPGTIFTVPPNFNALGIESDGDAHADVKQWLGTAVTTGAGSGKPEVDVTFVGGVAFTGAANFETAFNGTGYGFTSCTMPTVTTTGTATALGANAVNTTSIQNDAITAAKINTGAFTADAYAANAFVAATFAASSLDGKGDWNTTTPNTVIPDVAGTAQTIIGTAGATLTDLGGMSTGMKGQVNTEVDDVISTDTGTEEASVPAAAPSIRTMLQWVFQKIRNKETATASALTVSKDDGTTTGTSTAADVAGTFTKGKQA